MRLIEFEDVSKRFGKVMGVKAASFTMDKPEIVALVGNNGAGKTTLINLMLGYMRPSFGRISVVGRDPFDDAHVASEVVLIDEKMRYDWFYSLEKIIRQYDALDKRFDADKARRILKSFGIRTEAKFRFLSKGMKNLFNIALGLSLDRPVTVMDEPAAGLDEEARLKFYRLLLEEFEAVPRLFVVSTHMLGEFYKTASRIMTMCKGEIVCFDDVEKYETRMITLEGKRPYVEHIVKGREVYKRETVFDVMTATIDNRLGYEDKKYLAANNVTVKPVSVSACCINLCHGREV